MPSIPRRRGARRRPFRTLDADDGIAAMVLWGDGGTFCAGADLRAVAAGWDAGRAAGAVRRAGRPVRADGTDPAAAEQAGDRRRGRSCGGRRARTRAVVRPASRGGRRGVRRLLPTLGCAADRRRHRAPAPPDRAEPRARHDPHRSGRARRRSLLLRPRESSRAARRIACRRGSARCARSLRSRRPACAPIAIPRWRSGASTRPAHCAVNSPAASRCCAAATPPRAPRASSAARAAADASISDAAR